MELEARKERNGTTNIYREDSNELSLANNDKRLICSHQPPRITFKWDEKGWSFAIHGERRETRGSLDSCGGLRRTARTAARAEIAPGHAAPDSPEFLPSRGSPARASFLLLPPPHAITSPSNIPLKLISTGISRRNPSRAVRPTQYPGFRSPDSKERSWKDPV